MWTICNELKGSNMIKKDFPMQGDPQDIADGYNLFISELIPKLLEDVPDIDSECNLKNNNRWLQPTTECEILEIIKKLN